MNAPVSSLKPPDSLLAEDDVLARMWQWHREGLRTALVTLVGIEGAAPRPLGAQMAVADDGRYCGYLSGGCLEKAIALEACDVIAAGRNRLVRFGRGSRYIDVRLPCGSGLDLYFDCCLSGELLQRIAEHEAARRRFVLKRLLTSGISAVHLWQDGVDPPVSSRDGDAFARVFFPRPRLLLLGSGPAVAALALLASSTGLETEIWSPDEATRTELCAAGLRCAAEPKLSDAAINRVDASTAVVLIFHEHDIEPAILTRLLRRGAFYIGVLGNRAVHRQRLQALAELGFADAELARIRAPIGSIAGAKSKATLAVGILAELMAAAKACNLVA
jgi:xanthine dehydrogenase accessory factor